MACYHPMPAVQDFMGAKPRLNPSLGEVNLTLPCGSCLGCKVAKATEWAHRCSHETRQWAHNSFVTLTYDQEHCPPNGHLEPEALTLFFKRLRQHARRSGSGLNRTGSGNIRYFACGEYGGTTGRPHYHAILFNCGFSDAYKVGKDLYESPTLNRIWGLGKCRLGSATPASAAYIAQYSLKKVAVELRSSDGYLLTDSDGVLRPPPFARMSRKPAVGANWLDKYSGDLAKGYFVVDGRKCRIPRAYMKRLFKTDPGLHDAIRSEQYLSRAINARGDISDPERLKAAEFIHQQKKSTREHLL